ncbi:acyl-CoA dehydrogenase family protein [Acidisphaera rubrifaciens]|uniref:3-sulfinopropanoyl-CoA desulfinase n=1 Tax=Acidisphaera rubrifaciens HS-AP3 TaxID=1231350 RepID=A0A0D6P7Z7_9PROT|nr:acyl-CoA dehydrogenase family protein [Acidisphaera rubrifaciens]GAN77466.1 acyl-CoA dehydrogenase [Acidisphaera rubrifaciens HS-AP3]
MLDSTSGADTLVVEMAQRFAQERLAPQAAAREKAGRIEPEIIAEMGELGFLGATTPAEWGGSELDAVTYALLLEEIAAGDGSVSTLLSVHNSPSCAVLAMFGSDAQKDRFLRPLAAGEHVGSFALTEPAAGSDASALRTRAVRRGDRYVINGSKQFISSGGITGSTIVFAMTDPAAGKKGMSAFVVPKDTQGYRVARVEEKLGQKASETCALSFEDMEVPEEWRIGAEGEGYRIALSTLESGRIGIAAQSIGMARAALEYAIGYARDRQAFGRAIVDHQAVGFRLVECKTKLEAARQLTLHAARLRAAKLPALEAACMAKLFASEAAEAICTAAIQTLGGYGYLADYPVERIYRDVRVCQIYEGTSDVQKIILQRML